VSNEYQRGYYAGINRKWPEHRPPLPPHPIWGRLLEAAQSLRDRADSICAQLSEDDEIVNRLGAAVDTFDDAMIDLGRWLKSHPEVEHPEPAKETGK
jgi:hypothetical protein